MKYKVGDRVKIKENLIVDKYYNGEAFIDDMKPYVGQLAIINQIVEDEKYKLDIDSEDWVWTEDMLEPKQFTKSDLKDGDIVTLRNNKRKRVIGQNLISEEGSINLNYYINKLINVVDNSFDIIKIERPTQYETVFEYKEEILDKAEKEYLSGVIRPFRNEIRGIVKEKLNDKNWISIDFKNDACMDFPNLKKKDGYKGMKVGKLYSLEELGL